MRQEREAVEAALAQVRYLLATRVVTLDEARPVLVALEERVRQLWQAQYEAQMEQVGRQRA